MTPVALPNFVSPSHGAGVSHGKQAASGFREALGDAGRDRHHRNVDSDARSASRKLIERLAVKAEDVEASALALQEIARLDIVADDPGDAEAAAPEDASAGPDDDSDETDDAETLVWLEAPKQRPPVAAHDEPPRDHGRGDAGAAGPAGYGAVAASTVEGAAPAETASVIAADPSPAAPATDIRTPRPAPAESASAPRIDPPSPKIVEAGRSDGRIGGDKDAPTGDSARVGDDTVRVSVVSGSQAEATGDAAPMRQFPYASSIAMLNLMTQRDAASPAMAARRTAPQDPAAPLLPTDGLPQEAPAPDAVDTATIATVATDPEPVEDRPRKGPEAADAADDDASHTAPADKAAGRPAEPQIIATRLGATAASVVETIAAHPAAGTRKPEHGAAVDHQAGTGATHSLKIQLRPVELGEIAATLRMSGDRLSVEIATEKQEAYDRLNIDSDSIAKALRTLGLQVDQITVLPPQVATASAKADGGMSGQTSGNGGQQFGQSGASTGGGSEGQRGTPSQGEQRNGASSGQIASKGDESAGARGLFI